MKRIYATAFDSVNFIANSHQRVGINRKEDRVANYERAYEALRFFADASDCVLELSLNQVVDSEFFTICTEKMPITPNGEPPFALLTRGLLSGRVKLSTFEIKESPGAFHTVSSYALCISPRLKEKFKDDPDKSKVFISSRNPSLSYTIGASSVQEIDYDPETGVSKRKNVKPSSRVASHNHYCDFVAAVMERNKEKIKRELKNEAQKKLPALNNTPFNVYKFLSQLRDIEAEQWKAAEEQGKQPKNRYVRFSNAHLNEMDVFDVILMLERLLHLEDLGRAHPEIYDAQRKSKDVNLYTIARHFRETEALLNKYYERFSFGENDTVRCYANAYIAEIAALMYKNNTANRSAAYDIFADESVTERVAKRVWDADPALRRSTSTSRIANINPKLHKIGMSFVNECYNLHYAWNARCDYISDWVSLEGVAPERHTVGGTGLSLSTPGLIIELTHIGTDKEGFPQWME